MGLGYPPAVQASSGALAILLAVTLLGACTGTAEDTPPSASPTTAAEPTESLAPGEVLYRYVGAGLTAIARFQADGTASLEVTSTDGTAIEAPALYALLAADGARVDLAVDASAPIPAGGSATFVVEPGEVDVEAIGMLVLVVGGRDLGGFVRAD